jgi:uncharacterized tellurite resistance protein B-like protein
MFDRLRALLGAGSPETNHPSEALATALLLLETARSDFEITDSEQQRIRELLAKRYTLDVTALDALLAEARASGEKAVSLHEYVQTLNDGLDAAGKRELMSMLWQVAYADGRVDKYEEHLLRRLVDLLHIPMPDYIETKIEAGAGS